MSQTHSSPSETLKLLADPTRLRIVCLLGQEELSVAELQEVLDMGQSRISSHLALLRGGGLVADRKEGKRTYYSIAPGLEAARAELVRAACGAAADQPEARADREHLQRSLEKRRQRAEQHFNEVAGRLGKNYCPGRSWEAIGHFLLHLTPKIDIVDLGAGEGMIAQLLARRANSVHCIDSSARMVEVGTELAARHGFTNLFYKRGDIEDVPLRARCADLALLSQALHHAQRPARALAEAHRLLRKGGRAVVIDLREHTFEKARELYADTWLGFTENTLYQLFRDAGFKQVEVNSVAREVQEPFFETLLATGVK